MTKLSSKKVVMQAIFEYFVKDEKFVLLALDMGFSVLDDFFNGYRARSFNTGIAEQGSLGVAAGLSLAGMRPIVYSQIPFLTMRAFEQIRYDICEHNLDVVMVGVGANNYFEALGRSHCMDEDDVKLMTLLPNLTIISPTDDTVIEDIKMAMSLRSPVYIRSL